MAEFLGCGLHGPSKVLGYEAELHTVVLACGCKYAVLDLQVPIFEMADADEPAALTEAARVPVGAAISAAEGLPAKSTWEQVVERAESDKPAGTTGKKSST